MRRTRLRLLVLAVCCLTLAITIAAPLFQFFLVFNKDMAYMHILIVTGASALIAGVLGIASSLASGPSLPALHAVAAVALGALMGSFNTQTYLDIRMKCNLSQAVFTGCQSCACALGSTCTTAQLLDTTSGCASCSAPSTDLCGKANWQVLLLPYTGLIEAVLLSLPAVFSLLLLVQNSSTVRPGDLEAGGRRTRKAAVGDLGDRDHSEHEDWPLASPTQPTADPHLVHPAADAVQQQEQAVLHKQLSGGRNKSKLPLQQITGPEQWADRRNPEYYEPNSNEAGLIPAAHDHDLHGDPGGYTGHTSGYRNAGTDQVYGY